MENDITDEMLRAAVERLAGLSVPELRRDLLDWASDMGLGCLRYQTRPRLAPKPAADAH
jgi:hypothetical protein